MHPLSRFAPTLSGKAGKLFGKRPGQPAATGGDAVGGVPAESLAAAAPGRSAVEPLSPERRSAADFDISSILRLRTFLYLIGATALFLFQIYNTLSIKELSKANEKLRERLRISTSISTAQQLKVSEIQSIHNITGPAEALGLSSSAVPPVDLEPLEKQ